MRKLILSLMALALVVSVYSCRETNKENVRETSEVHKDAESALDQAGDAIDDAVDATGDALEDAGDAIEEAAKDTEEAIKDVTDGE